jgi:hypothetical protein
VLSAIRKSVNVVVDRGRHWILEHLIPNEAQYFGLGLGHMKEKRTDIVALGLEPVHREFGTSGTVGEISSELPTQWVRTTSAREFALRNGDGARRTREVALECGHIHYIFTEPRYKQSDIQSAMERTRW